MKSNAPFQNCAYVKGGMHETGVASYSVVIPPTPHRPAFNYAEVVTGAGITSARAELSGVLCALKQLPQGEPARIYTCNETIVNVLNERWDAHTHKDIVDEILAKRWKGLSFRTIRKEFLLRIHPELATLRKKEYKRYLSVGRFPGCEGLPKVPKGCSVYDTDKVILFDDGIPF